MPSITVGPLSNFSTLTFSAQVAGTYAATLAQVIANAINSGANGSSPIYNQYVAGAPAVGGNPITANHLAPNGFAVVGEDPRGFGGIATFRGTTSPQTLFVNGADQFIVVDPTTGPVSLQGGAAGGFLIAGAGAAGAARNVTYTNITPTGTGTDQIVVLGGNNLIQTATFGTGTYNIQTGDGNDTINVFQGNATINAGTGFNQINLGSGNNFIGSEGNDSILGTANGQTGGTDTIQIGAGQASINTGGSSFLINDDSSPTLATTNPLLITLGSGTDTVNMAGAGSVSVTGTNLNGSFFGLGSFTAVETGGNDGVSITGTARTNLTLSGGRDTVNASGTSGSNAISAGSGNDTLLAGVGNDTLTAGTGSSLFQSGSGGSTTFTFNFGRNGGSDTISGFKASDALVLNGANSASVFATATGTTGGAVYQLGDGTTLTILGTQPPGGFKPG